MLKLNMIIILILFTMHTYKNKNHWWQSTMLLMIMSLVLMSMLTSNINSISTSSTLDMMSSSLLILSTFITSLMFMSSTKILHMNNMKTEFLSMCMVLLLILINAFSSKNIFMFYIWFEASLIPTMMIILLWGYQPERLQASMYMMMYTVTASLPMLMIFLFMMNNNMSTMMLMNSTNLTIPTMMLPLIISGFLVKLPMFLMHLWLPKAHVEAPIAGSMILAAILLKLGGYGICRLTIIMPHNIIKMSTPLICISLIGAVMTSMICLRQPDLKSLIAYSSVGHMGLMLSGTLTFSNWGMYGALLMMIAHGISSSALFSLANINYELFHTRSMFLMKGMMSTLPTMTMWWFMFTAINMAAPPSINLLSEIMLITSTMSMSSIYAILLGMITFLTGTYSLVMYGNTQHGSLINFMNPLHTIQNNNYNMLLAHLFPITTMIMISEYSSMWL